MEIPYIVTPRKDTGLFNSKIAIWLFLASEVMLFGGFFSAYIFLRLGADYPWPERTLPVLPGLINTFVLIGSSVTVVFAWAALKMRQWGKFQLYMGITIACAGVFMVLKTIEYSVKLGHQAVRTKDGAVIEGHLSYKVKDGVHLEHGHEPAKEDFALDHEGKKIEENVVNFEASAIAFNTVRYERPWVEAMIARAAEPQKTVVFGSATVLGTSESDALRLQREIDALNAEDPLPPLPQGAVAFRKNYQITVQSLERLVAGSSEDRDKRVVDDLISAAVEKPATITLAAKLDLQTAPGKAVSFEAGTPLDLKLLDAIKKAHLAARAHNGALRTGNLREQWKKAKAANPGKRDWEFADQVAIDQAAIASKLMPEQDAVPFAVEPATAFRFRPRDIQEAPESGALRDGTALKGKLLESPMHFHYVDAIDFRHLVQKAEEKGIEAEVAIENSWLLKENPEMREAWEWHKGEVAKLEKKLLEEYGTHKDENGNEVADRVPTETERYRMGWQDFVSKAYGVGRGEADIHLTEQFMGPDYHARADKHTFPALEIPREQIQFASKFAPAWNTYYAIYFTMTGLHGLHVIGGALVLAYYLFFGKKMYLSNPEWLANRVEVGGLFWHFVDLVWIFLFPILYLM